jgi:hypothetical protein
MTRLGAFKTYFGVRSQGQLFAFAPKKESVVPAAPALGRNQKIQTPSNSDLSREAHRLKVTNIVLGSEAIR